ncbi:L-threonylcarbamoyladenylate synthase [Myxosarcina sp. GI1]|uniref:L-threonylcarbamoyladenylate synthase n=1 Tax=Myxosarcina sp. GI1 TaxID=1541065 RepID=UPI000565216F|nr:L-threonylcarbamoyladenylate synthase [Myxosarcina sp. GI1]
MSEVSQTKLIAGAIAGKVVSFPTDTVPALAVKPELGQLIYDLKQRPAHKPLILMGASEQQLLPYITGTSRELTIWRETMAKYFPGAVTLVLPASSQVPKVINTGDPTTVGIRIPDSAIARSILEETGVLATTSANLSGEQPLTTMAAIAEAFPQILVLETSLYSQTELIGSGQPSTVAKWEGNSWVILRQGKILFET